MRLLLDAHLSSRRLGMQLHRDGHDDLGLDRISELEGLSDEQVFGRAISENRILITCNVSDFVPILRERAEAGESHSGCVLVTVPANDYGAIRRGLERLFTEHPRQANWTDRARFLA